MLCPWDWPAFLLIGCPPPGRSPQTLPVWTAPTPFESCSQVPEFPTLQLAQTTAGGSAPFLCARCARHSALWFPVGDLSPPHGGFLSTVPRTCCPRCSGSPRVHPGSSVPCKRWPRGKTGCRLLALCMVVELLGYSQSYVDARGCACESKSIHPKCSKMRGLLPPWKPWYSRQLCV